MECQRISRYSSTFSTRYYCEGSFIDSPDLHEVQTAPSQGCRREAFMATAAVARCYTPATKRLQTNLSGTYHMERQKVARCSSTFSTRYYCDGSLLILQTSMRFKQTATNRGCENEAFTATAAVVRCYRPATKRLQTNLSGTYHMECQRISGYSSTFSTRYYCEGSLLILQTSMRFNRPPTRAAKGKP